MQQRYAVFLLNLKPAKMRGVLSEGMIMCASTPDKVEIINPPAGVAVGDKVTVDGYPGDDDMFVYFKFQVIFAHTSILLLFM